MEEINNKEELEGELTEYLKFKRIKNNDNELWKQQKNLKY